MDLPWYSLDLSVDVTDVGDSTVTVRVASLYLDKDLITKLKTVGLKV